MATIRFRRFAGHFWGLSAAMLALASAAPALGNADVAAAEALARGTYYEGVEPEDARALGEDGIARLIELLRTPDESRHHAQILEVLGMSGHPDAYATIREAADAQAAGEIDRDERRKRAAILVALGHLAREDDRALAGLESAAAVDSDTTPHGVGGPTPGGRDAKLLRRSAVSALAISGRPEARATLQALEIDTADDPELERHVRSALREIARNARPEPGSQRQPGSRRATGSKQ